MTSKNIIQLSAGLAAAALCLISSGCGTSRESRVFIMTTVPGNPPPTTIADASQRLRINLASIHLPAYLDRPQIVTRSAPYEIKASEFNRWGMPVEDGVAAVLADVLSRELPGAFVNVAPLSGANDYDCRVQVEIVSLDGVLGGEVRLTARWHVILTQKGAATPAAWHSGDYRQAAEGNDYTGYVSAICAVLDQLGRAIAEDLALLL